MNNLKAKLKKEGGFTLIEMLIVVAIIAILIAIGIPMVNKALERAREATDAANERSALGLAMVEILTENKLPATESVTGTGGTTTTVQVAYYAIAKSGDSGASNVGDLVAQSELDDTNFNYGKGTFAGAIAADNAGKGIKITYTPATKSGTTITEDSFTIAWISKP